MHDDAYISGRSVNNIKYVVHMTIWGGRTKQLDIFCRVTGFMSDFLSFIVVVLIRFFHGALQINCFKSQFLDNLRKLVKPDPGVCCSKR